MLDPNVHAAMLRIAADVRKRGIPFRVTSTYRSFDQQDRLYRAWLARGKRGLPAARPGLSTHEYGAAFDAAFPASRTSEVVAIARAHGLVWFGKADPVHFDVFGSRRWNELLRAAGLI